MDIGRDLARAFDYGYEQGKKDATQWISVKDRLPEEIGVYATLSKTYNIRYYECLNWTGNAWDCSFGAKITHWMPLPEPPEGE